MNNSIDQQFVEFVVKSLVSNPEAVIVERRIDEKGVLLELTVDPDDLGRVIGKRGATAQSIRTLLRALGTKNDARYNLKIVDNGVGGHTATDDGTSDEAATTNSSSVTKPQDDDLDEADTSRSAYDTTESDVVAKTRKELEAYDDLDV
ncbi:MAG TPA: KH domain-containing protein [Candidatus Saccharimonadales bacterium]|jgi:hypothetical protein